MAACTEEVSPGVRCVGVAEPDTSYCAIHRRCRLCRQSHGDKMLWRCTACERETCIGMTFAGTDPKNQKDMIRLHTRVGVGGKHTLASSHCGPMVRSDRRVA